MPDKLDNEIEALLGRLTVVHTAVDGKGQDSAMGPSENLDEFTRLSRSIRARIRTMSEALPRIEEGHKGGVSAGTDHIRLKHEFNSNERKANDDWNALDALHRVELAKHNSKVASQLGQRTKIVQDFRKELDSLRDGMRQILNPGYQGGRRKIKKMEDSELFKGPGNDGIVGPSGYAPGRTRNNNMTEQQRQELMAVERRDKEMDEKYLGAIGENIDHLLHKAEQFGDILAEHDRALDEVEGKIGAVHERLENVNGRMKDTLQKVRGSDKICMDVMCILAMLGLVGIVYKMTA